LIVPIRAVGLKFTGDLVPGKLGIVGLTKPLIIVDRLSGFDFDAGLLIFNLK
jgi:hypothetical protein